MTNLKRQVLELLDTLAEGINERKLELIEQLYSEEGEFLPEGRAAITKGKLSTKRSKKFLEDKNFKIQFIKGRVTDFEQFVFVEALAETSFKNNDVIENKISSDFLVLKYEDGLLKIFRYMFNNVKDKVLK